jgi:hypothetical protein
MVILACYEGVDGADSMDLCTRACELIRARAAQNTAKYFAGTWLSGGAIEELGEEPIRSEPERL